MYNTGYIGYSMSVRARDAYQDGEKPCSKWIKSDILDALKNEGVDIKDIKKYPSNALKQVFLYNSSWHHTSKFYNKTNFYDISYIAIDKALNNIDDILIELDNCTKKLTKNNDLTIVRIEYTENISRFKNHPNYKKFVALGIKKNNTVYLKDNKQKRLNGSYIRIVETFNRAPRGCAAELNSIKKTFNL